jgi:hypothetical protein
MKRDLAAVVEEQMVATGSVSDRWLAAKVLLQSGLEPAFLPLIHAASR